MIELGAAVGEGLSVPERGLSERLRADGRRVEPSSSARRGHARRALAARAATIHAPRISPRVRFSRIQTAEIASDDFTPMPSWRYNSNLDVECVLRARKSSNSRSEISLPFHLLGVG